MAHKAEESGDTEGLVAVADNLEIDRIVVEEDAEPCDDGVNGDHPEDADNTARESNSVSKWFSRSRFDKSHSLALLDGLAVVQGMAHDQEYGYAAGEEGANAAHDEAEAVKGNAAIPEIGLVNC